MNEAETFFENGGAAPEAVKPEPKKRKRTPVKKAAPAKVATVAEPVKRRGRPPGAKNKAPAANGAVVRRKAGVGDVLAATSKLKAEDHGLFNKFAGALEALKPAARQRLAGAVYHLFGK